MWAADDDLTAVWTLCHLDLRVMPDGEPPFDVSLRTRLHTFRYKGDVVPVLYDPDDHDRVVVDAEADLRAYTKSQTRATADAAAFKEHAEEFRDQAAEFRAATDVFAALARAKASGDQAEVERLKAEFLRLKP
jgi:hypothetical protein